MHPKNTTPWPKSRRRLQRTMDVVIHKHEDILCTDRARPTVSWMRNAFTKVAQHRADPENREQTIRELGRVAELIGLNAADKSAVLMTGLLLFSDPLPRSAADLVAVALGWRILPNEDRPSRPSLLPEDLSRHADAV